MIMCHLSKTVGRYLTIQFQKAEVPSFIILIC